MSRSRTKIQLSRTAEIPFDRLCLSQDNVRRVKAGVAIEELAEDIARRTLLTSLTVRPILDDTGQETGRYDIPAGGRRFRALELLVAQKRLPKDVPVPCIIREAGTPEEDSLAENIQRAPLHPLDQYRAFAAMRERGMSEDEIAAAFFTTAAVVRQRLRLAACAPDLLEAYADDRLTLDQLMAFTVNPDHARQVQVFASLSTYTREPYAIRRMLTETTVRASDKRVQFVGLDTYEAAGGVILRDLFQADDGGWLQDVGLLDRLVAEALARARDEIAAEGWRWVEAAVDQPYGIAYGLRRIFGRRVELTEEQEARREAIIDELAAIEAACMDDDMTADVDARYDALRQELAAFDDPQLVYSDAERANAGVFVSIAHGGALRVDRGYVRREDEPTIDGPEACTVQAPDSAADEDSDRTAASCPTSGARADADDEPENDGTKPISDRLLAELTAVRTVALREALGRDPRVAFLACLHALCLRLFYRYAQSSCVEIVPTSATLAASAAPGLGDMPAAQAIDARHRAWEARLGGEPDTLWATLAAFDDADRQALFAHCVGLSVNAVSEPWNRRPQAVAHADRLAGALDLDLSATWQPTAETYLGRVTKAHILHAVREARGETVSARLSGLKKPLMAEQAEVLLDGTGWLPEALRSPAYTLSVPATVGCDAEVPAEAATVAASEVDAAADSDVADLQDDEAVDGDEDEPAAMAA